MEIAVMTFSKGKIKLLNRTQKFPTMTLDELRRNYSGEVATPEQLQQDKVELPGPEWRAIKARRYYVAFKEGK